MARKRIDPLPDLETLREAEAFGGFTDEDFAAFDAADFSERMTAIRSQVKPKLAQLGKTLAPLLSEEYGTTLYTQVAQHLRRTVNPPQITWVAFGPDARAYKPYPHLRVAICGEEVRVLAFVEDDAPIKTQFADALARNADALSAYFAHHPTIHAYDLPCDDGTPKCGHDLDADILRGFGEQLKRVKALHARFGIAWNRSHPVLASGPEFLAAAIEAARVLRPLYDCGAVPDFVYEYAPEPIAGL